MELPVHFESAQMTTMASFVEEDPTAYAISIAGITFTYFDGSDHKKALVTTEDGERTLINGRSIHVYKREQILRLIAKVDAPEASLVAESSRTENVPIHSLFDLPSKRKLGPVRVTMLESKGEIEFGPVKISGKLSKEWVIEITDTWTR
jgi:hypothetical protein